MTKMAMRCATRGRLGEELAEVIAIIANLTHLTAYTNTSPKDEGD